MRRVVFLGALVTALAVCSTPVAAQTETSDWQANVSVGSAFGTRTAPAVAGAAGYSFGRGLSLVADFGTFETEPFEDRRGSINPTLTIPADETEANAYHLNANLMYRIPERARLSPYLTAGVGTLLGPLLVNAPIGRTDLEFDHDPQLAANLGAGLTVRLNRWLGLTGEYRYFAVNSSDVKHINRFSTGLTFFVD